MYIYTDWENIQIYTCIQCIQYCVILGYISTFNLIIIWGD